MWGAGVLVSVFLAEIALQGPWTDLLGKRRVIQNLKRYGPQNHLRDKQNTPTMGGAVFLLITFLAGLSLFLLGKWTLQEAVLLLGFPLTGGAIGLADDLLKFFRSSSEGLRSLEKLALQLFAALVWSYLYMPDGVLVLAPGIVLEGISGRGVLLFFLVGALNAANISDGLDGLLTGMAAMSFAVLMLLTPEGEAGHLAAILGLGLSAGFLAHNFHPAKVFMGDCGSHFLGGLLVSVCAARGMLLLILPLGFMMGLEVVSVIIQIIAIRGFNKKVFLMSPLHHHFEISGWSETSVVYSFWALHAAGMLLLLVFLGDFLLCP